MPIVIALIQFVGFHLTFNSGIATATELANYHDTTSGNFFTILNVNITNFDNITIPGLKDTFSHLFDILGITNYNLMGVIFGYMLSVQLYHLLFDLLVFFIHLIHNYCEVERWCK